MGEISRAGVHRTNFEKKMPVDKYLVCRKADAYRFGAMHPLQEKKMPFIDLSTLEEKEIVSGFHGKFAHAEKMTATFWRVEAGAELPEHAHPHEQISVVVSGKFEMTLDGETRQLEAGTIAVIPSNMKHGGRAITACEIVDTFSPVREDYR